VSFAEGQDVKDGKIVSDALKQRLEMVARDAAGLRRSVAATTAGGPAGDGAGIFGATEGVN